MHSWEFLFREWQCNVYLEGDEDDEVGQVEAEHLGAGRGSGHHLQGGGEQRGVLGSGSGQAWDRETINSLSKTLTILTLVRLKVFKVYAHEPILICLITSLEDN